MYGWHNKNLGIHPQDPNYDSDYDAEEDYEAYLDACEDRFEQDRLDS